ncbi:MAG: ACT domain-containing protein [Anaerolineae bacterium]|nr:ACT domain-containing protein [Anaerolineae bacterium]
MSKSYLVEQIFPHIRLFTDDLRYDIIHFPLNGREKALQLLDSGQPAFSTFIQDKDEITIVVPSAVLVDFADRLQSIETSKGWRLITFDIILEHDVIGFMAAISECLAGVGVSIFALSAYERDHLLVPADQIETAWQALDDLLKGHS